MTTPVDIGKFWAKTSHDPKNHPNAFHPLICHLIDVSCVALIMWNRVLPPVTKQRLAKPFGLQCKSPNCGHDEADENCPLHKAGRIIAFLAGLHDLGKCSPPFALRGKFKYDGHPTKQLYSLYVNTECDCDTVEAYKVPHGYVTALKLPEILESSECRFPRKFAKQISEIIGGHHGIFATGSDFRAILENYKSRESLGDAVWDRSRTELFDALKKLLEVSFDGLEIDAEALDKSTSMVLAGFVSVADWIGSNSENDLFVCAVDDSTASPELDLPEYLKRSSETAERAIKFLGWSNWPKNTLVKEFDELFPTITKKRDLQSKAIDIAKTVTGPGIFIVEALMGEGKTETAMFFADYFNAVLGTRGIYFALPTQATSDQMFGRVSQFLQDRFEESGEFVNLMLQHGHASLSDEFSENVKEFRRMRGVYADEKNDESGRSGSIAAAEWFTYRKRGLLAPFGVGTIDQILFAALQTKHVFVRLFGLAHKTIIIDEVHAYDAYMSTLLGRLLEWLGALGSPVIILSATLPKHRRTELIRSYLKGRGQKFGEDEMPDAAGDADVYPRISYAFAGMPEKQFRVTGSETAEQNTRKIQVEFRDEETFVEDLKMKLADGGCAAVICNTVRRAQNVYDLLKADDFFAGDADDGAPKLDLLHSAFRLKDRQLREKRALLRFGKKDSTVPFTEHGVKVDLKVKRPHTAVLVSTQIIEQSLDLDFDIMVSDLAPADLLLQRAGRLQRHRRDDRPKAFVDAETGETVPSLWILRPPLDENGDIRIIADGKHSGEPDLGASGFIYDKYILLRSWFALRHRNAIDVPGEVEELIEKIYGDISPADDVTECEQGLLDLTQKFYQDALKAEEEKAKARYINHPSYGGPLSDILLTPREEDSPDLHPDSQAMTRLIEPTCQVACLWKKDGVYYTDATLLHPINIQEKPDRKSGLEKEVILNSIGISNRSVVFELFKSEVPEGFRLSPLLRRHRYLVFNADRKCEFAGRIVHLDMHKGLIISKKEEE